MTNSTSATHPARLLQIGLLLISVVATVALTACSASAPRGELAENKQILSSCPSGRMASLVAVDGSNSGVTKPITAERMTAIESIVRRTAVCSGVLRVIAFSSTSAGTVTLFDGPLHLEGATENARLKRVPRLVEEVMATIRTAYGPTVAGLDGGGSDIIGQLRLAGEWISQVGGKARLHLYLLTDGFQNVGVHVGARAISKREAAAQANRVDVPKLPGASVVVAGLGKVAGAPPRSNVVEGLVAYYDALCKKTGAASCTSVTDYTPEWR